MDKVLINDLIKLSGKSLRAIARTADLDPSNLSGWLNDRKSYIGDEGVSRLYEVIGLVDSGLLQGDRVHHFQTDRDLAALQRVIDGLMGFTKIYPIRRNKGSLFKSLKDGPVAIFSSEKNIQVVVRLTPKLIKEMHKITDLPYLSPDYLQHTEWGTSLKEGSQQSESISLADNDFSRLLSDEIKPTDVLNIIAGITTVTWVDVIEKAKTKDLSPSQVIELLETSSPLSISKK